MRAEDGLVEDDVVHRAVMNELGDKRESFLHIYIFL